MEKINKWLGIIFIIVSILGMINYYISPIRYHWSYTTICINQVEYIDDNVRVLIVNKDGKPRQCNY